MSAFDQATLERHGVTAEEYERLKTLMGREPNLTDRPRRGRSVEPFESV